MEKGKLITTHEELLKLHGRKVTCFICGDFIEDAKISVSKNKYIFICQNELRGGTATDKLGYRYCWCISDTDAKYEYINRDVEEIRLADEDEKPRTIDDLKQGDVIVNEDGGERKILGICGEVYFISYIGDFEMHATGYTLHELKKKGYTLQAEEPSEETIEIEGKNYKKTKELEDFLKGLEVEE